MRRHALAAVLLLVSVSRVHGAGDAPALPHKRLDAESARGLMNRASRGAWGRGSDFGRSVNLPRLSLLRADDLHRAEVLVERDRIDGAALPRRVVRADHTLNAAHHPDRGEPRPRRGSPRPPAARA